MKHRKYLQERIRGWLPKQPVIVYTGKPSRRRFRPILKLASVIIIAVLLISLAYFGARTYIRYSNPVADVTASYYEKTLNSTNADAGDIVEVRVSVYWHGYVLPEFKREVKIVDPIGEGFILTSGNNTADSIGYGGSYSLSYTIKCPQENTSLKLSKPKLFLDGTEIPLTQMSLG